MLRTGQSHLAHDPYGFPDQAPPPQRAVGSNQGRLLAAAQVLILGLSALSCASCATWLLSFADTEEPAHITVLVWLLFSSPAWPLVGAVVATVFLRSVVQRWWAVAGPNVVVGAGAGCLIWSLVFGVVFCGAVGREM